MNLQLRQDIERQIVMHLVATMAKHGWYATHVFDGEETESLHVGSPYVDLKVWDIVSSVDCSTIHFFKDFDRNPVEHGVDIVLGNDGWDCISDYSYGTDDDFQAVMDSEVAAFSKKLEEMYS